MTQKLRRTLEAVWYAAGPAQFLMYAVWTVVVSGMFSLEGSWQLLATAWKMLGALVFAATVWGTLKQKQALILASTMVALIVGAIYTSKAMMFTGDADILRGATQSHYMVVIVLVAWGFYLANLCSRQMMEFKKMGIGDE